MYKSRYGTGLLCLLVCVGLCVPGVAQGEGTLPGRSPGVKTTPGLRFLASYKQKNATSRLTRGQLDGLHWIGAKKPVMTLVVFTDHQCYHCHTFHRKVMAFVRKHPSKVRLAVVHYPLDHNCHPKIKRPFHTRACFLAKATICAGAQGAFWRMSGLFHHLGGRLTRNIKFLPKWVNAMGLSLPRFQKCMKGTKADGIIADGITWGIKTKVMGTPTLLLNGQEVSSRSYSKLSTYLAKRLAGAGQPSKKPTPNPSKKPQHK